MSCIRWVPWLAASTSRTSVPATPSASSPTTATMTTQVRLEPLTLTEFAASAEKCAGHSTSWKSERDDVPIGTKRVAGSLRTRGPNHEDGAFPNDSVMLPLSFG